MRQKDGDEEVVRALTPAELLSVWEWGQERSALERGLALLTAASPDETAEVMMSLSLGRRDERLLLLRELQFGPELDSQVSCPSCGDHLELALRAPDLRALLPSPPDNPHGEAEWNGWRVVFRLPDSRDLLDVTAHTGGEAGRQELLRRCVVRVIPPIGSNESSVDTRDMPPELEEALAARMEHEDAAAMLTAELTCPSCGHHWTAAFDILSYLWEEVRAWAYRTLREIHLLASAYGWRETDILAISPWRRQVYLQMTGHA
jgi:hypothetical protein